MAKLCSKLVFICLTLLASPTLANDSEAAIGIGGLVIKKSENIAMLSEKLFVSEKIINVQYEFVNNSSNDILTIVAFPLAENAFDPSEHEDKLKFSARVEGENVLTKLEKKIIAGTHGDGNAVTKYKLTYYWDQKVPSNKKVIIEHSYIPIIGGSIPITGTGFFPGMFCQDKSFTKSIRDSFLRSPSGFQWNTTFISYILKTGANWSGPIRDFRLIVDKGSPDNLVSFCGSGVRKISATQFEMRKRNFIPKADLDVLILKPELGDAPRVRGR